MRKIIAAINMTLDGVFDHTAGIPDAEVHQHYAELIRNADAILYGRITYQLMQFWQDLLQNPSEEKSMNDFAAAIDSIPKIVFSNTLQESGWNTAAITNRTLEATILELKNLPGKDILIGSRSLIMQLMKLNLIDELQLCIYPVIAGSGTLLFENITNRTLLSVLKTKLFAGGAVMLYYEPINEQSNNR